jgi:hypothetical protein
MAMYLNFNGKPWLKAENNPDYPAEGTYEVERYKWVTMYTRTFDDWERIRNWGLNWEYEQVPYLMGLAVELDKPPNEYIR